MARSYQHISESEEAIIRMKAEGKTRNRYIIERKDARIKSLEMENELMRDFLSRTGRK